MLSQRGLGRIFLPQKAQKILDTGYYTLRFRWNADETDAFATRIGADFLPQKAQKILRFYLLKNRTQQK